VRIDNLPYSNIQMQGAQRRTWLRQHAPQHLEQCAQIILHALQQRQPGTAHCTLVLGAGACTEVPLAELARASDEMILTDLDLPSLQQGRAELTSTALRKRVRLVECDISGGVSAALAKLIARQDWSRALSQGASALFDTAALCLEQCAVPDPPALPTVDSGSCGVIVSSLLLSQLFSYPLLDLLDTLQRLAPQHFGEQERHARYQAAAQAFRVRIITAHLHLLQQLLDSGGAIALLSDIRGFAFTNSDITHRRVLPLVPRSFFELVSSMFAVLEERHWEWLTDLPTPEHPGRGYEVVGYVLNGS
jgi:hypothetical protein